MPQIDKNASSVPKLTSGKWPVSLGQLEAQLKNVVGSFPITAEARSQELRTWICRFLIAPFALHPKPSFCHFTDQNSPYP